MNETKLMPMKSRGPLTVYRLKPKPFGAKPFIVGHADGRTLQEFSRYKRAVLWMKAQSEAKT